MLNKPYSVILGDDHEIMLDGLAGIIQSEPCFEVAGLARNGKELVALAEQLHPDLCIVDLNMPEMNGLEASECLLKKNPEIRIVVLSMYKENSLIKKLKSIGIKAYVSKTCDSDELIFAMRQVMKGKTYFSGDHTGSYDFFLESEGDDISKISQLTKRELEIVDFLCKGFSNGKIASLLYISKSTVDNHRCSIMKKLDVHNVVELTRFCIKHKLISE